MKLIHLSDGRIINPAAIGCVVEAIEAFVNN